MIAEFKADKPILSTLISKDLSFVFGGSVREVILWRTETGETLCKRYIPFDVYHLDLSADNRYLLARGGAEGEVFLMATGLFREGP